MIKFIKNIKRRKEREEVYNGLKKWKEIMDEMRASGNYSDEKMKSIERWWASACKDYANMF